MRELDVLNDDLKHFELTVEHDDKEFKGCCKKHSIYDRAGIIRLFITPLIIYPLLLLSMFQFLSEIVIGQVDITTILHADDEALLCYFYGKITLNSQGLIESKIVIK